MGGKILEEMRLLIEQKKAQVTTLEELRELWISRIRIGFAVNYSRHMNSVDYN